MPSVKTPKMKVQRGDSKRIQFVRFQLLTELFKSSAHTESEDEVEVVPSRYLCQLSNIELNMVKLKMRSLIHLELLDETQLWWCNVEESFCRVIKMP